MHIRQQFRRASKSLWPCLALGLSLGELHAAGFSVRGQSASTLGTAGAADGAGTQDISSLFANPATITAFRGHHFSLGLAYVMPEAKFEGGQRSVPSLPNIPSRDAATGRSEDDFARDSALPAIYGVHSLSESFRLGWGLTAPYGTYSDYSEDWVGRYQAKKTDLRVINLDLALAYQVNEKLSAGFGIQVQRGQGAISGASNFAAAQVAQAVGLFKNKLNALAQAAAALRLADTPSNRQTLATAQGEFLALGQSTDPRVKDVFANFQAALQNQGQTLLTANAEQITGAATQAGGATLIKYEGQNDITARYEGEDIAYGYTVGLLYQALDQLTMGLSYRSSVQHKTTGDIAFSGNDASSSAYASTLANGDAALDLKLPAVITFGLDYQPLDALHLFANATRTQWSSLEQINITYGDGPDADTQGDNLLVQLGWQDVTAYSLGASYQINPRITLRSGLGLDTSPTTDSLRSPRSPDNDRRTYALGARYATAQWLVDLGYMRTEMQEPTLALDEKAYPEAQGRGNLTGSYQVSADSVMLQYQQAL